MTIIVGIDQSFTSCGVVAYDSVNDHVVTFDRYVSDKELPIFDRAWNVAVAVGNFILTHHPDVIRIEGLGFGGFGNATRDLAGLQFTIINYVKFVLKLQTPIEIISPKSLKQFATQSGKAEKKDMIAAMPESVVQRIIEAGFKKTKGLSDIADAYWLALFKNKH